MKDTTAIRSHIPADAALLTLAEVAQILRVDDTTVRRWARLGAIEVVILPHTSKRQGYRVRRETLNDILKPYEPDAD